MRTTFRLCLVAAVVAAIGLVAVPAASATTGAQGHASITKFEKKQNKKIKKAKRKANKAHTRIENLKGWSFDLDAHNRRQDASFNELLATVNAIVAGVPDIIGGLTALQEGLVAIQGALEDPVTGLLGLNLARPQFGVYGPDGSFLGSTGDAGGSGPDDSDASDGTGIGAPSLYVVDFTNDVSSRVYSVNVFPGTAPGATPVGAAVNCSQAAATCAAVEADSDDVNHVLVKIGTGAQAVDGTAFGGFSVTALSG